jgi:hypothetical protein
MLLYLGILSPLLAFPALMLLDRLERWTAQPSPRDAHHVVTAVVENPAMTSHQPTHTATSAAA